MNSQPLLQQLPDIHLPEPVSWWPPAPGWWILAVLILALVTYGIIKLERSHKRNAYRREAKQQLQLLEQAYQQHQNPQRYLQELMVLLRRLLKTAFPDKHWESLPATQLITCLEEINVHINHLDTDVIESYLYNKSSPETALFSEQLHASLKKWIQQHRRPG